MTEKLFSKDHEWICVEADIATVGITDHAQSELGDVVYIELPTLGKKYSKGDAVGVIESVKAASDIFIPVSGEVVEINSELVSQPELVNENAETTAWIFKVKLEDSSELELLMNATQYTELLG